MKNQRLVWSLLACLLAAFLIMRSVERKYASPPPVTAPPPLPGAPVETPTPTTPGAAQPESQGPVGMPSVPTAQQGNTSIPSTVPRPIRESMVPSAGGAPAELSAELDRIAKELSKVWPPPSEAKLVATCNADPIGTEKQAGVRILGDADFDNTIQLEVARSLCDGSMAACSRVTYSLPSRTCSGDGCKPGVPVIVPAKGEQFDATQEGCKQWLGETLFVKSAAEGRPDRTLCISTLSTLSQFQSSDVTKLDRACEALAADIKNGSEKFCMEWTDPAKPDYKVVAVCRHSYIAFIKGESQCEQNRANQPTCAMLAKLRKAALAGDASACGGNAACLRAMGSDQACPPAVPTAIAKACVGYGRDAIQAWSGKMGDLRLLQDRLEKVQGKLSIERGPDAANLKDSTARLIADVKTASKEMARRRDTSGAVPEPGGMRQR
jgi:hypothetical protein